jgi:peptidoglycan hydrolase-like protein with peptidoglycan-binding domain
MAKLTAQELRASFVKRAPAVMAALIHHCRIDIEGSAAVLGNLWAESKLQAVNEGKPLVAGSLGGFGWAQWTGPRRRAAFKFWSDHKMDPNSDAAQLAFLIHELLQRRDDITAVMRPGTLEERTRAFELAFERAHKDHKNYPARYQGARMALAAYYAAPATYEGKLPAAPEPRQWAEDKLAAFEIRAIQARLKEIGLGNHLGTNGKSQDGVDGLWGAHTTAAIVAFQKLAGITADGHWGPQTQAALARGLEEPKAPQPAPSDDVGRAIEEGLTKMFGSLISLVGGKTLLSLAVALVAPYAARYGIGEESLNKIVADLALLGAAFGSADATRKAVARASE